MSTAHADSNQADTSLDYLTVASIEWVTGHERRRMPIEQKRAKHRVHQQQFMLRQRQRMKQLHCDLRRHALQLKFLEATKESAALIRENEGLHLQLLCHEAPRNTDKKPLRFQVYCQESPNQETSGLVPEDAEEVALLELLDLVPDVSFLHAESPVDVDPFAWCRGHDQAKPLTWPSSPSCAVSYSLVM